MWESRKRGNEHLGAKTILQPNHHQRNSLVLFFSFFFNYLHYYIFLKIMAQYVQPNSLFLLQDYFCLSSWHKARSMGSWGGDDTGWGQDTTLCGAWETSLYMFQEINAFFASVKQKCLLNKSQKWKYLQFDCNMCIWNKPALRSKIATFLPWAMFWGIDFSDSGFKYKEYLKPENK